jgi:microcystin-dependent protein
MMSDPFIGEIRMFAGSFAPRGWALCQGQLLAISANTALFSILGTTYGGNGTTTFALPNLGSRSPVGAGQSPGLSYINLGEQSGTETVTILSTQMPQHVHTLVGVNASVAIPTNSTVGSSKTPSNTSVLSTTNDTTAGAEVDIYSAGPGDGHLAPFNAAVNGNTAVAGGSQPLPIRNPYLGINFIIATAGIYPSHN